MAAYEIPSFSMINKSIEILSAGLHSHYSFEPNKDEKQQFTLATMWQHSSEPADGSISFYLLCQQENGHFHQFTRWTMDDLM